MAQYSVENHRLLKDGEPVRFVRTSMHGGHILPKLIVEHDTAGSSAAGSISWLTKWRARGKSSAHLVIDTDGEVTQLLEFNREAYHAGPSRWKGKDSCNKWSIGIENANPGKMVKLGQHCIGPGGKKYHVTWCKQMRTKKHGNGWWKPWTAEQIAANEGIIQALKEAYPINDIAGHFEIDTRGWKVDPNPTVDMAILRSALPSESSAVTWPLAVGSTGGEVEVAQKQLKALGYEQVGEADGIFGKMTRSAVLAWQAEEERQLNGELHQSDYTALMKPEAKPMEVGAATQEKKAKKAGASTKAEISAGLGVVSLSAEVGTQAATGSSLWQICVENLDSVVGQVGKVKTLGVSISAEAAGLTLLMVVAASVLFWLRQSRGA